MGGSECGPDADAARSSIGPRFGPAAGGLKMADIPPDADVTTERNHSRDGGEDQQQSAVLPPPPRDTPGIQVDAGLKSSPHSRRVRGKA